MTYDQAGNRLIRRNAQISSPSGSNIHNTLNQLFTDNDVAASFTYDANGNVSTATIPWNPTRFYFDGDDRLRSVKSAAYEIEYLYDYEARLVERTVRNIVQGSIDRTQFQYLFSKPIVIKRNGAPLTLLTWDPSGSLLRIRRWSAIGGTAYPNSVFPMSNGLGDIVRLVDDSGNVQASSTYDSWGNSSLTDVAGLYDCLGLQAGLVDRLTGMTLLGARWYYPLVGRWLSEDTPGGADAPKYKDLTNLYVYVGNNPISFIDPTGFSEEPRRTDIVWPPGESKVVPPPPPDRRSSEYAVWVLKNYGLDAYSEWLHQENWEYTKELLSTWGFGLVAGTVGGLLGAASSSLIAQGTAAGYPVQALTITVRVLEKMYNLIASMTIDVAKGNKVTPSSIGVNLIEDHVQGMVKDSLFPD